MNTKKNTQWEWFVRPMGDWLDFTNRVIAEFIEAPQGDPDIVLARDERGRKLRLWRVQYEVVEALRGAREFPLKFQVYKRLQSDGPVRVDLAPTFFQKTPRKYRHKKKKKG